MRRIKTLKSTLTNKEQHIIIYVINTISLILIFISIATSVYLYYMNRGLWIDESRFSFSLVQRNLSNLASTILDYDQSAPIGYLYLVKITTLLLGVNEFTLRIWSFIAYIFVLIFTTLISKKVLHIKYPLVVTSFVASLPFFLGYSHEFKPYMTDAAVFLFFFLLYYYFDKQKISLIVMCISSAILIWFSSPILFLISATYLYEFICALLKKDKQKVKLFFLLGLVTLISFGIYYVYWLSLVVDADRLAKMWSLKRFPLIPTEFFHFYIIKYIIYDIFIKFGPFRYLVLFFSIAMCFFNVRYLHNKYITILYVSFLMLLLASWMDKYPMHDRMCIFLFPPISLIFFYALFKLYDTNEDKAYSSYAMILIFIVIQFSNVNECILVLTNKTISPDFREYVPLLESEIQKDDILIVEDDAFPGYSFQKRYEYSNLPYKLIVIESVKSSELTTILENSKNKPIYLMTYHIPADSILDSTKSSFKYSTKSWTNRINIIKFTPIAELKTDSNKKLNISQ